MVTATSRVLVTAILLAALPTTGRAQDAKSLLNTVTKAMGTENLRTLQYSASGSTYDDKGQHMVVKSHNGTMDFNAVTSTAHTVIVSGNPPAERVVDRNVNSSSPWNTQYDFWITPFGFLKGAAGNAAVLETKSVFGEPYRVISFTLPGNHRVSGFINTKDMVERVQLSLDGGIAVEGVYREYADFGGVKVPTIVIQNRAGALSLVLILKDVKPNG